MKRILIVLSLYVIFLCACNEKPKQGIAAEVEGKYIDRIEHYTIYLEDGSTFNMSETDVEKIFYLVRHAEKDTLPLGNPKLTQKGLDRAARLSQIFEKTQIDALYSTMFTRTLWTVDSLADSKGLVIYPYEAKNFKTLAEELDKSTEIHKSLIVGHSNTTPVLANHLYGKQAYNRAFDESDYDNFIVVLDNIDSTKQILKLKYK